MGIENYVEYETFSINNYLAYGSSPYLVGFPSENGKVMVILLSYHNINALKKGYDKYKALAVKMEIDKEILPLQLSYTSTGILTGKFRILKHLVEKKPKKSEESEKTE